MNTKYEVKINKCPNGCFLLYRWVGAANWKAEYMSEGGTWFTMDGSTDIKVRLFKSKAEAEFVARGFDT